jgi:hypothetical protein
MAHSVISSFLKVKTHSSLISSLVSGKTHDSMMSFCVTATPKHRKELLNLSPADRISSTGTGTNEMVLESGVLISGSTTSQAR